MSVDVGQPGCCLRGEFLASSVEIESDAGLVGGQWFEGGVLGVNEAGRHEVAGASLNPFGNDLAVASEMDEDQIWAGLSQLIAVDMFESGTCHDCSVISTFGQPSGDIS
jgi:hypothetical protein